MIEDSSVGIETALDFGVGAEGACGFAGERGNMDSLRIPGACPGAPKKVSGMCKAERRRSRMACSVYDEVVLRRD